MPLFELINPSDAYTFEAPDIVLAGVAVVMISGNYGAKALDGEASGEATPILFGWGDWLRDRGVSQAWVDERSEQIASVLESFLIGGEKTRREVAEATKDMAAADRMQFQVAHNEQHRTSMSNIGKSAYGIAANLRKRAKPASVN